MSEIRDKSLAALGQAKIDWVKDFMPVLDHIGKRFEQEKPFAGLRMAISVHLEAKTAYLGLLMRQGGAQVAITGSNPLSTKDDICAALDAQGMEVNAFFGATAQEYTRHLKKTLEIRPHIVIDDGGDLVNLLHGECAEYAGDVIGGCEETTTGILRLKARAAAGELHFPMMAVNDAHSKYLFDNRYGTGQSVWDGIIHATNLSVAGRTVVVAGYGWCGRGIALRAKGLGANVIVTEIDSFKAIEAIMDGFRVLPMIEAAKYGDIFVTATGCNRVIRKEHFAVMKNNALLANAGHFDVEVDKNDLVSLSDHVAERKPFIEGYYLKDGRVLNLLSEGRLVNITAGNGHAADIMDLSFAVQALSALHLAQHGREMEPGLHNVPAELDREIARIKIESLGMQLDSLSQEQKDYLSGWQV
ncbi:MAG: adenosylhomocysteinase [Eubacteriales bacterium]|nr:adenosylhomocysteinase [Eubacteriales bacterium]